MEQPQTVGNLQKDFFFRKLKNNNNPVVLFNRLLLIFFLVFLNRNFLPIHLDFFSFIYLFIGGNNRVIDIDFN